MLVVVGSRTSLPVVVLQMIAAYIHGVKMDSLLPGPDMAGILGMVHGAVDNRPWPQIAHSLGRCPCLQEDGVAPGVVSLVGSIVAM